MKLIGSAQSPLQRRSDDVGPVSAKLNPVSIATRKPGHCGWLREC